MNLIIAAAAAATFAIHDFTADFWQFWEAAQNQPIERQAQLWQQLYVSKHQAVFDELAQPCKGEWNDGWFRAHYLPELPQAVPAIRTIAAGLSQQLDAASRRFLQTFPDMQWSVADSESWPRLLLTDARSRSGAGALLFGVDTMSALRSEEPDPRHASRTVSSLSPFVLRVRGIRRLSALDRALGGRPGDLCRQGAESVGQRDRSRNGAAGNGPAGRCSTGRGSAADFLRRFESTAGKDATLYFNDTNSKDAVVRRELAQDLGALVARELSKQYSLQTVAHWSQAEAKPKIRAALEQMSASH